MGAGCCPFPVHSTLLLINLLAGIAAILLGSWLLVIKRKASSVGEFIDWSETHGNWTLDTTKEERDRARTKISEITLLTVILVVLCYVFGIYLIKRAFDLFLLMYFHDEDLDCMPCLRNYRRCMGKEYLHCLDESNNKTVQTSLVMSRNSKTRSGTGRQRSRIESHPEVAPMESPKAEEMPPPEASPL